MARITKHPDGPVFDCDDEDTILRAALRAGHGMSYSCNVGSCGNCRFELIEGEVEHLRSDAPAWSERDLKRNRWLGCQARPLGDCVVKFRDDPAAVSHHRPVRCHGVVREIRPVTRDMSEFVISVDDDGFLAGQYALITPEGVTGGRAYSMSNLPGDGQWRFIIKRVPGGAATGQLFDHLSPGDRIALDGPYGTAWLREDSPRDLLLLAGGSGLSPMVSIARGAFVRGMLDDRNLMFFYGARSQGDLFDPEREFGADLMSRIQFIPVLSEPDTGWTGETGLVHEAAERLCRDLASREIYFAGPAAMSTAVQKMVHAAGAGLDQMHFDEFY